MSLYKYPLQLNVLEAAQERIGWTFATFSRICVSFSGGKDSTVMLHLTAQMARAQKRKISVLFIDWEAQFSCTIEHVNALREGYRDVIEHFYWVALPLTTQNSLSQYQPEWQCWAPDVRWVRQPPEGAITAADYFDFYQTGMTFEAFVRSFSDWFALHRPAAMLVGIRADESYNRFLTIANNRKHRFADDKPWTTTAPGGHAWYVYPLYDWKTATSGHGLQNPEAAITRSTTSCFRRASRRAICASASPSARNSARDSGSITFSSPSAGPPCASASAACAAAASTPGRTTTFMATGKSSNPITSAGATTPCSC